MDLPGGKLIKYFFLASSEASHNVDIQGCGIDVEQKSREYSHVNTDCSLLSKLIFI